MAWLVIFLILHEKWFNLKFTVPFLNLPPYTKRKKKHLNIAQFFCDFGNQTWACKSSKCPIHYSIASFHNFKLLAGFATGIGHTPTFYWQKIPGDPEGVAQLGINFNDGKPDDVAFLERHNPIPRQPNERDEDIDQCIFKGVLLHEPNVLVSLTGGCPFEDSFEVSFETVIFGFGLQPSYKWYVHLEIYSN